MDSGSGPVRRRGQEGDFVFGGELYSDLGEEEEEDGGGEEVISRLPC